MFEKGEYIEKQWKSILGTLLTLFITWKLLKIAGRVLWNAFTVQLTAGAFNGLLSKIGGWFVNGFQKIGNNIGNIGGFPLDIAEAQGTIFQCRRLIDVEHIFGCKRISCFDALHGKKDVLLRGNQILEGCGFYDISIHDVGGVIAGVNSIGRNVILCEAMHQIGRRGFVFCILPFADESRLFTGIFR